MGTPPMHRIGGVPDAQGAGPISQCARVEPITSHIVPASCTGL
jgi:hypothetical protein